MVEKYLQRLASHGARRPTLETLTALHRAHLLSVPFENLDIPLGKKISLVPADMLHKLLTLRRGGFCYELNGVFAMLLSALHFEVQLLSAKVFNNGSFGPEFDHMLLLVQIENVPYIADVGFGECFRTPLPLGGEHVEALGVAYKVSTEGSAQLVMQRKGATDWQPLYQFSLTPRALHEFESMCAHQQASPRSLFTQKSICSRATMNGRVSLSHSTLIVTELEKRTEKPVVNAEHYRQLLAEYFQITLPLDANVERILLGGIYAPKPMRTAP